MKEFFIGLLTGVFLTAITGWYYMHRHTPAMRHAQEATAGAIRRAVDGTQAKLDAWHLNSGEIEAELSKTGRVVRRQVREFGTTISDAASDARITGTIKTKFALDKTLAAGHISVSTIDGNVTLSGTVAGYAQIGQAILLAKETDGVRDVASTLKVKP
jgi:osmotically-inducible protein OsmY